MRKNKTFGASIFLLVCLLLFAGTAPADTTSSTNNRRAFVVGLNKYPAFGADLQLTRAKQDADDVASVFRDLGFEVEGGGQDEVTRGQFKTRWRNFVSGLDEEGNDTVAIFLSGHGFEMEGNNYFLTSDAPYVRMRRREEMEREAVSLKEMLLDLKEKRPRLVLMIIDACRTNPFVPGEYQVSALGGTSVIQDGVLMIYSASGDDVAYEKLPPPSIDNNRNSIFTRVLLAELNKLKTAEIPLYLDWSNRVRLEVSRIASAAGLKQSPKAYSGLEGDFCLLGCSTAVRVLPRAKYAESNDAASCKLWASLEKVANRGILLDYVSKWRGTHCADLARSRLSDLERKHGVLRVVSIGSSGFGRLRAPDRDAKIIAETFRDQMGATYKTVEATILSNESSTKAGISEVISRAAQTSTANDVLVLFLSGMAVDIAGSTYFIGADAVENEVESYVNLTEIGKSLAMSRGRILLILDACGTSVHETMKTLLQAGKGGQLSILTSASEHEVAYDDSAFAELIAQALRRDPAALDAAGNLTIESLSKFVRDSMAVRRQQRPALVTNEPSFILRSALQRETTATLRQIFEVQGL